MRSYKELVAWQLGMDVVKNVYSITKKYPAEEMYGLTSQMRRAAISIPSNIAEGYRRASLKEWKQFVTIAMGSAAELETQVIASREIGVLPPGVASDFEKKIDRLQGVLYGLSRSIKALSNSR